MLKHAHIHAEESDQEGKRQENKRYPAETPETGVELEGLARIADAYGFVHLYAASVSHT